MIRYEPLLAPTLLPAAVAAQYTVPLNTKALIKKITLMNMELATAYAITIYLVPVGGAASTTTMIVNARGIAPKETLEIFEIENHVLNAGDTVQAFADVANKVSMRISGALQT
jgi:hypothetical protein